jgi:hypothetical protein
MDAAFANGATSSDLSEDRVIFPLLVTCRDIVEEVLFAIKDGFGRAALRATRTMYECLVTARYLNLHPEKTDDFWNLFYIEWAKVYQDIPPERRNPMFDAELGSHVAKYAQGRRVGMNDLRWSGALIETMAKEAGTLFVLHSSCYTLPSAYIHPGAVSLLSTFSQTPDETLHLGEQAQDTEAAFALQNAHDLLMNAVDLRMKYAPSAESCQLFDACSTDFAKIWGFAPHI